MSFFEGKQVITVTYNDGTDAAGKVDYSPTGRVVHPGATKLGWSYSTDLGKSWKYGGAVPPPPGWAALWGDPAITSDFLDQRNVFISNLAIPSSKMPAGGISGDLDGYIGGACIARSRDGGITFKSLECVSNNSHFYDGGSMAAAGSARDRSVYAAYVDVNAARIDVYRAPDDDGHFKLMADPFPGMKMFSHPRLRFDRSTGSLYVGAIAGDGGVYLNRFTGGAWDKPILASNSTAGNPRVQLSDRKLRTGYQFSYDVGATSKAGNDGVRTLYTVKDTDTNRFYVRGSRCSFDLSGVCRDVPEWGTTPGNFSIEGQQFNPSVRAFPGFLGLRPAWKATYMSTEDDPSGNTVSIKEGDLTVLPDGTRLFLPFDLVEGQVVCPDARGYWGDYNELQLIGFKDDGTAQFIMPHSDSSKGCASRWTYTSQEVHVSAVVFE
ncbi:MAG TPA: hypothetical protein VF545_01270 [Thermoleophilaceae bacterium]